MRTHWQLGSALMLALASVSCSASGPAFEEIEARIPAVPSGEGRVFFYRESGFVGAGVQPYIYLNDEQVGESVPGGFFFVDAAAGKCRANCSTEVEREVTFTLAAQETKYVRTSIAMGVFVGHAIPELVSAEEGREGVADCAYTGEEALLLPAPPEELP